MIVCVSARWLDPEQLQGEHREWKISTGHLPLLPAPGSDWLEISPLEAIDSDTAAGYLTTAAHFGECRGGHGGPQEILRSAKMCGARDGG